MLGDIREVIASGAFAHAQDDDDCRFCEMDTACGKKSAVPRVAMKLADAAMAARRRLAARG